MLIYVDVDVDVDVVVDADADDISTQTFIHIGSDIAHIVTSSLSRDVPCQQEVVIAMKHLPKMDQGSCLFTFCKNIP